MTTCGCNVNAPEADSSKYGCPCGAHCTHDECKVRARGREDGKAAGSWVIDGNTSDETCKRTLHGLDIGDPLVHDALPMLQLGEWADDPQFHEILSDIGVEVDEESQDDLWHTYAEAWSEGMIDEVERACRARLEG